MIRWGAHQMVHHYWLFQKVSDLLNILSAIQGSVDRGHNLLGACFKLRRRLLNFGASTYGDLLHKYQTTVDDAKCNADAYNTEKGFQLDPFSPIAIRFVHVTPKVQRFGQGQIGPV